MRESDQAPAPPRKSQTAYPMARRYVQSMIPAPPGPSNIATGPEGPMPACGPPPATHASAYLLDELAALKRTVDGFQSRLRELELRVSRCESPGGSRVNDTHAFRARPAAALGPASRSSPPAQR